jgi:TFIIF-interacting CTD phosphatase-like protein
MNFLKNIFKSQGNINSSIVGNNVLKSAKTKILKQDLPFTIEEERKEETRTIVDEDFDIEDIFSNLVLNKSVSLPEKAAEDSNKLTLFLPMDEILLYTYLPDENMGLYDIPKSKKFDLKIELKDYKTFAFIYFRDHLEEFLNFVNEKFETILYSTGERKYVDKIIGSLELETVFRHRLYQENCHLYKNPREDKYEFLKDINLITNRSLKRKVLLETSTLNFVLSPDNSKIYINF